MSENDQAPGINRVSAGQLPQELISGGYVFKASGPASAGISDTAVLNIPTNEASLRERRARETRMLEIVAGTPEPAMNEHRRGKWPVTLGKAQIAELIFIVAVAQPRVSQWRCIG